MGTEEHGEWPQELTGRQNSGYNGSDPRNSTGVQLDWEGQDYFKVGKPKRGTGREVGVPGTLADAEQMSFAQGKDLSLRAKGWCP